MDIIAAIILIFFLLIALRVILPIFIGLGVFSAIFWFGLQLTETESGILRVIGGIIGAVAILVGIAIASALSEDGGFHISGWFKSD